MNDPDAEFPDRRRWNRNVKKERDEHQIYTAKLLFEWWWHSGISEESIANRPRWKECLPEIQAFWMDGAEQVFLK
jgi:hypothetical protein